MRLIGLTGGIATGKTTVAMMLAARGAELVDADRLAREVVAPGSPALADIAAAFGEDVLDSGGGLDRAAMARLVFANADRRRQLESITHPRITDLMAARIGAALAGRAPLVVADIPLLFENRRQAMFDGTLLVYAPRAIQLRRLAERDGIVEGEALQRLGAQLPIEDKRELATWVIDNGGSVATTTAAVARWWDDVVTAAG